MNIAITGSNGFLGENLAKYLASKNHNIICLTRYKSFESNVNNLNVVETDYTHEDLLKKLRGVDALIHLAFTRLPNGPFKIYQNNEKLTYTLYSVCAILNINNIVFTSSISVYGISRKQKTENDLPTPYNMYGVSKLHCEEIGNLFSLQHNMKIKNLRLAHVFGFNEKNNYMINLFIRKAALGNTITVFEDTCGKREFIYLKDVLYAIEKALLKDVSGIYNIGSNASYSNVEMAKLINKSFNNPKLIIEEKTKKYIDSYFSSEKAAKELNFCNNYTVEEGLDEIRELMKGMQYVPELY